MSLIYYSYHKLKPCALIGCVKFCEIWNLNEKGGGYMIYFFIFLSYQVSNVFWEGGVVSEVWPPSELFTFQAPAEFQWLPMSLGLISKCYQETILYLADQRQCIISDKFQNTKDQCLVWKFVVNIWPTNLSSFFRPFLIPPSTTHQPSIQSA